MFNNTSKRRRIKPFARPTSFDYNVRFDIRQYQNVKYGRVSDPFFAASSNDESFRVMEGELLVKNLDANSRYNDKELHVFSFANGLKAPPNTGGLVGNALALHEENNSATPAQAQSIRSAILKQIQYMGVAVTEFDPARDPFEQGFVATIAGLNTIFNNGKDTIYPGSSICCDLPYLKGAGSQRYSRALQGGVPREKLQFIVRPRDEMLADYGDESLVNRMIIGTAISYARPGDSVDVILHRMNYSSSNMRTGEAPALGLKNLLPTDEEWYQARKSTESIRNAIRSLKNPALLKAYNEARGTAQLAAVLATVAQLRQDADDDAKWGDPASTDLPPGIPFNAVEVAGGVRTKDGAVARVRLHGLGGLTAAEKKVWDLGKVMKALTDLRDLARGLALITRDNQLLGAGGGELDTRDKEGNFTMDAVATEGVFDGDVTPHLKPVGGAIDFAATGAVGTKPKKAKKK